MKRFLIMLAILPSSAIAQGSFSASPIQWCYESGIWFGARNDGSCHIEDKGTRYATTDGRPPVTTGNAIIAYNSSPKCPDGYSVVLAGGAPMCAKELIEPSW